jgi:hypothetical protein
VRASTSAPHCCAIKEERSYKVRATVDVQAAPQKHIEEYISDSSVGSDDDAPATRRAPPRSLRLCRGARGRWRARCPPRATATITATQTAEAKKKKRKRIGPAVFADTATVSFGIKTIDGEDEEDDTKSPSATTVPSPGTPCKEASTEERATETPRRTSTMEERPRLSANTLGDAGSQKRARKAPPPEALQARAKVGDQVSHRTYTHSCFTCSICCASI